MHTIRFKHQSGGRFRQLLPCVLALLGGGSLTGAWAQSAATGPNEPGKPIAALTREGVIPSGQASVSQGNKQQPVLLLAQAAVAQAAPGSRATTAEATDPTPTYLRDVLPILMGKCSRCHNEQARFVYNWLDYRTAYTDRWEIRRRIWDSWKGSYFKESMPIANSPESLAITDEERATIRDWVIHGAVRGVRPPPTHAKSKAERFDLGKKLFVSLCAACHQPTGQGLPNVFPPLAGSDFLNADKNRAIKLVLNGRQGEVVVNGMKFNNSMPKFPLDDEDIANALTFVYNSFGNSGIEVTTDEVRLLRLEPPDPEGPNAVPQKNPFE